MNDSKIEERIKQVIKKDIDKECIIKKGGVLGRVFLEIQGNKRYFVETAIKSLVFEKLAKEPHINLLYIDFYDIEQMEKEPDEDDDNWDDDEVEGEGEAEIVYSAVCELEIISDTFEYFLFMVMRYGPTSVDLIKPESVDLTMEQVYRIVSEISVFSQEHFKQMQEHLSDPVKRARFEKMYGIER